MKRNEWWKKKLFNILSLLFFLPPRPLLFVPSWLLRFIFNLWNIIFSVLDNFNFCKGKLFFICTQNIFFASFSSNVWQSIFFHFFLQEPTRTATTRIKHKTVIVIVAKPKIIQRINTKLVKIQTRNGNVTNIMYWIGICTI